MNSTNNGLSAICSVRINKKAHATIVSNARHISIDAIRYIIYSCCYCCVAPGRVHAFIMLIRFTDWINDLMTNRFAHFICVRRESIFPIDTILCCSWFGQQKENRSFLKCTLSLHEYLGCTKICFDSHDIFFFFCRRKPMWTNCFHCTFISHRNENHFKWAERWISCRWIDGHYGTIWSGEKYTDGYSSRLHVSQCTYSHKHWAHVFWCVVAKR